jgi:hypothetical protein
MRRQPRCCAALAGWSGLPSCWVTVPRSCRRIGARGAGVGQAWSAGVDEDVPAGCLAGQLAGRHFTAATRPGRAMPQRWPRWISSTTHPAASAACSAASMSFLGCHRRPGIRQGYGPRTTSTGKSVFRRERALRRRPPGLGRHGGRHLAAARRCSPNLALRRRAVASVRRGPRSALGLTAQMDPVQRNDLLPASAS